VRRRRPSNVDELSQHSWSVDPGVLQIDLIDERRLREIADQLGVPIPDSMTTSDESKLSGELPISRGKIGGSRGRRSEAHYVQPSLALVLRRVIDRIVAGRRIAVAEPSEIEGVKILGPMAVDQRMFALAELPWLLSSQPELGISMENYKPIDRWPHPISLFVPLAGLVGPRPSGDDLGRLNSGREVHACVFGHAAEWADPQRRLTIRPIAVFERRGSHPSFNWRRRTSST
jgi:hypothetical protein